MTCGSIEGEKTLDAFHSTALDYLLRANEIEYVAFTGFHTNWCVESSARSAYDKGYRVIVVSDCTGTDTNEEQQYAETFIFPKIGQVMTAEELLSAIEWRADPPCQFPCRQDPGAAHSPAAAGVAAQRSPDCRAAVPMS